MGGYGRAPGRNVDHGAMGRAGGRGGGRICTRHANGRAALPSISFGRFVLCWECHGVGHGVGVATVLADEGFEPVAIVLIWRVGRATGVTESRPFFSRTVAGL